VMMCQNIYICTYIASTNVVASLIHFYYIVKKYEQTIISLIESIERISIQSSVEVSIMRNESNSKVKDKATMCQGDWMIK